MKRARTRYQRPPRSRHTRKCVPRKYSISTIMLAIIAAFMLVSATWGYAYSFQLGFEKAKAQYEATDE